MGEVKLLDCTLRDGGYCNNWDFGENSISQVIQGLENSGVDFIECGYLKKQDKRKNGSTLYSSIIEFEKPLVNRNIASSKYVCMINLGEFDIDDISEYYESTVDGIRVAFHKIEMERAVNYCIKLKKKGYLVFLQPMVILDYSEEELEKIIQIVNNTDIDAFYIVDSFGAMDTDKLIKIYDFVDKRLRKNIVLGFHGHNNLQMSYANAQEFLRLSIERDVIVDSCIFGMGRGAGNLSTELFEEYLNTKYGKKYMIAPILNIYDQVLARFYLKRSWGYSLPNYLSARHNAHPSYAQYWSGKNTLSVSDLNRLFENLDELKKNSFDEDYAEYIYKIYMNRNSVKTRNLSDFNKRITNRNIMVVASGKSSKIEKNKIIKEIKESNCVVISINREYPYYVSDYIFVSNLRRFESIEKKYYEKTIATSNIEAKDVYATIDYEKYLNSYEAVEDNATLMIIKYLTNLEVNRIYIAGLDGFSHEVEDNYADFDMIIKTSNEIFDKRNIGLQNCLTDLMLIKDIKMVTTPKYIHL